MALALEATPKALALLRMLKERHGSLVIVQGGGCCDGSIPLCLKQSEFRVGSNDTLLGTIEDTPFYLGAGQPEQVAQEGLLLDVVDGDSDRFSLEATEEVHFVSRTRGVGDCRLNSAF